MTAINRTDVDASSVQVLTHKDLSSATNTFPAVATATNLVATTAVGGQATENTSNTWAKLATFTHTDYGTACVILAVTTSSSSSHASAIVSVQSRNNGSTTPTVIDVQMIAKAGDASEIGADAFKMISGAYGTASELWMKKAGQYLKFAVYQISRQLDVNATVTYNDGAAWQSAVPTGAVTNVSTNGVTAGNIAVVTTTGSQTLTGKSLTSPALTTPTLSAATPASAGATGTTGTLVWDASYVYICTATNTWKRAAIATW